MLALIFYCPLMMRMKSTKNNLTSIPINLNKSIRTDFILQNLLLLPIAFVMRVIFIFIIDVTLQQSIFLGTEMAEYTHIAMLKEQLKSPIPLSELRCYGGTSGTRGKGWIYDRGYKSRFFASCRAIAQVPTFKSDTVLWIGRLRIWDCEAT